MANPSVNDIRIPVNVRKSLSCHGVSFETTHQLLSPPPPVVAPTGEGIGGGDNNGQWVWMPLSIWTGASAYKIFPTSIDAIQRSVSRASSHYCDLREEDEDDDVGDLEGQKEVVDDVHQHKKNPEEKPNQQTTVNTNSKPPSLESRLSVILLDQGLFTVYKRLFTLCISLNVVALVLAVTGSFPYAEQRPALFSLGNILALSLCRSEAFLRVIFWLAVKVLGRRWVPLPVKTATTSLLQSLGGIHSSCGISSIAWLTYGLVRTLQHRRDASPEIIWVTSAILSLLCASCIAAFPLVRHLHHNVYERTHRFAGWTALALVWVFVILTVGYNPHTKSYDNLRASRLVKQQEFWFTFAITILIILPWITIRRVPVSISSPSGHASVIKFPGGVKAGILGRISRSPLSEWHAFGIISDGKDSHMMLAGAVGDFTKGLVSKPPTHLWVRTVHFAGLPYLVNMYERAVLVATGSGICVFLSFLLQPCAADVCVVWVTKGIEQNFGKEIKEMMSGHPEKKVIIHDTAISGRPNVAKLTVDAAKSWKADVVVVTSNPQGSRDVVTACKASGIPAFGPIWDS